MEDVLKYQRLQGAVDSIVAKDRITASALEGNFLVIGTERGIVHILALTGVHIQRYTPHPGRAIRGFALCFDGVLSIYSCAQDDDTVVVCSTISDDLRTTVYQFSETVTAIAVDYTSAAFKNDGMILVGTQSGRLIKYRPSILFGKKEKRVEDGKNSPVKAIAWQDNLVAWADDEGLYLFDIATKSAIGRVPTPCGPGDRDLYPVALRWTDPDQLLLGWAYTITVLKVKSSVEEGLLTEGGSLVVKVVHSWETDCVVAGVHAFDRDHVLYLGYSTLSADEVGYNRNSSEENPADGDDQDPDNSNATVSASTLGSVPGTELVVTERSPGASADLEVIVAKISTGDIVSADVLPLRGHLYLSQGPFQFQLLSSYDTRSLLRDPPHRQWQLHQYSEARGGDQGKAPLLFIASPEDIVIGRVRDVNDRVRAALGQGDLKLAVEVAQYDRASLRVYGYADLLEGYISQLLENNEVSLAAQEIARLAGIDALLWETWVYRFIKMDLMDYLCMELPVTKPRLESFIYQEVLDHLMAKHPEKLLPTLQAWSQKAAASTTNNATGNNSNSTSSNSTSGGEAMMLKLFDRNAFIGRLERQLRQARRVAMTPVEAPKDYDEYDPRHSSTLDANQHEDSHDEYDQNHNNNNNAKGDGILTSYRHTQEAKWRRQKRREARHAARHYFAALAHLHLLNKSYEKALNCYLHRLPRSVANNTAITANNASNNNNNSANNNANNVTMTNSGRQVSSSSSNKTKRENSISNNNNNNSNSTAFSSDSARQLQQEYNNNGDMFEEEDFDLESDDDPEDVLVASAEDLSTGGRLSPTFHNNNGITANAAGFSPVRERRKALDDNVSSNNTTNNNNSSSSSSNNTNTNSNTEHRHVFELIEREHLFHNIAGKIRYLVRLSRPLCQRLLLAHLDKLPIGSVAAQLQSDRELLLWYLNALFADNSARETYRAKEFSQLHIKQLQLSIEHRARFLLMQYQQYIFNLYQDYHNNIINSTTTSNGTATNNKQFVHQPISRDSELLNFLKAGWIAAPVALQEIDAFLNSPLLMEMFTTYNPQTLILQQQQAIAQQATLTAAQQLALSTAQPFQILEQQVLSPSQLLCEEKVYLLAMQGEKLAALRLLLETDDVDRVLYFLTVHGHGHAARYHHLLHQSNSTNNNGSMSNHNSYLQSSDSSHDAQQDFHQQQQARMDEQQFLLQQLWEGEQLWEEVVRRGLESPAFLQVLVTRLGDSGMDGTLLLKRMSEHVEHIPLFRQKMQGVLQDWSTMERLDRHCRILQQQEALALLSQKNRRQRRAIKIEAKSSVLQRCTICLRPLGTEAVPPSMDQAMLLCKKTGGAVTELQLPCAPSAISVCGVQQQQQHSNHHSNSGNNSGNNHHHSSSSHHSHHHHQSLLFFNTKNAVHHVCFEAIVRAEQETKRVQDESRELLGSTQQMATMEKRGMIARTQHTQLHR